MLWCILCAFRSVLNSQPMRTTSTRITTRIEFLIYDTIYERTPYLSTILGCVSRLGSGVMRHQ